jgi:hypothetical protein
MKKKLPTHIVLSRFGQDSDGISTYLYLDDMTLDIVGHYDGGYCCGAVTIHLREKLLKAGYDIVKKE